MKAIFFLALIISSFAVYSQDTTVRVKQIDSLVYLIDNSGYKPQREENWLQY